MDLQFGDIIGFSHRSFLGACINIGTLGVPFYGLSHIGIIGPGHMIYESTTLSDIPCHVTGKLIAGVQAHDPGPRVRDYTGRVYRYRLNVNLHKIQSTVLGRYLERQLGVPYDSLGAFRSRTLGLGYIEKWLCKRPENLSSLFCSEYLAAALDVSCIWTPENASRWNPNRLARALVNEKVYQPAVLIRGHLGIVAASGSSGLGPAR
jgi:hypothetical protein